MNAGRTFWASIIVLILLTGAISAQSAGSTGWAWQNPLPQGNSLYSIHFAPDRLTGLAVGADGTILRTLDGGFTWQKRPSGTDVSLSAVFVRDKENAFAVGARGTIRTTGDGGKIWRAVTSGTRDHLYGIKFAGPGLKTGWIVGTYGRV